MHIKVQHSNNIKIIVGEANGRLTRLILMKELDFHLEKMKNTKVYKKQKPTKGNHTVKWGSSQEQQYQVSSYKRA